MYNDESLRRRIACSVLSYIPKQSVVIEQPVESYHMLPTDRNSNNRVQWKGKKIFLFKVCIAGFLMAPHRQRSVRVAGMLHLQWLPMVLHTGEGHGTCCLLAPPARTHQPKTPHHLLSSLAPAMLLVRPRALGDGCRACSWLHWGHIQQDCTAVSCG